LLALFFFGGCQSGTAGGPGASDPARKPLLRDADETFTLGVTQTTIRQGESHAVSIPIKRNLNFGEDVSLSFGDFPKGLAVDNPNPVIKHGDTEARFTLTAADDASLGDFSLKVTGHPTRGTDGASDFKIAVLPRSGPTRE
jgi:hypothetical protein